MDNQSIELEIKATASEAKSQVDKLVKSLTNVENIISDIHSQLGRVTTNIDKNKNSIKGFNNETEKVKNSISHLTKSLSLGTLYISVKRLTNTVLNWMDSTVDYTEQLNLFNVVFKNVEKNGTTMYSNLGKEAIRFQHRLNEAFGTNKTQSLYMQGIFQSMGENVGIDAKYSAIMSETMTKLTYDLASLYNKSESVVAEALRAGVYAGQTKPLRAYGVDVTQTTMQPLLKSLGIEDRSVKELSQAEKEILRYIATLKQAQVAMGDLSNTIESPSNQMKIFKQQLVEAKVALTSLFIGGFATILPYANSFLMVVKEVSKSIATMFGIEVKDYNTSIASQEGAYDSLGESIEDATNKVKELKRQTLGFDQINNIGTNENNNLNVSSGIDQRLLDAIKGYDSGLEKVRMKATEIRDRIMEWLGFTKEIDPLTGAVSFKLKEGYSNLKLIGGIIATLIGFKLVKGLIDITKKLLGVNDLVKLSGDKLTILGKIVKSLKVSGWGATIAQIGTKLKTVLPIIGKVGGAVGGIAGAIFGSKGTYDAMKTMTKETENAGKEFGKYSASILGTVGSATLAGAAIGGPLGAAIGATTGVVAAGVSAFLGYKKGLEELADEELFGTLSVSTQQWTEMLNNLDVSIHDNTGRFALLKENLSSLNTTFQESSNELDLYNLKFGKLGQKISEEDSVKIINAIDTMCNSTNSMIDQTTNYSLELWGTTFDRMSNLTEEEEKEILNSIINYGERQKKELADAQNNITKTYDNAIKTRGYLTDEEYNYIKTQLEKIRELTKKEMSLSQTEIEYYKTLFADKNQKLDEKSYKNYKKALDEYLNERTRAIENTYNQEYNSAKRLLESNAINQEQFNKMITTAYKQRNKDIETLNNEVNKITDKVLEDLAIKYQQSITDNSKYAQEQRRIIENIFNNLSYDEQKIFNKFKEIGKKAAQGFGGGFSTNLDIYLGGGGGGARLNANGGIFSNGIWKNIPQFANGGLPSHGSMFIAGEAGAEIVGHINGRTEVLNKSQIASAIYSAVVSAMSQFNGGTTKIELYAHIDEGIVIDKINQKTKQTGVCPIIIST